ncbi:hypothetical protein NDU88_006708 [Pleurodeles waltl]|uniref:Uncharacterized protein n=1 Tax=Pleurodeles waltl TaxID=8319 RepID=A0AAV7RSU9_PLEWA|nr:hypothetical protein NDU88_006708 [Pleurodeles waltl]
MALVTPALLKQTSTWASGHRRRVRYGDKDLAEDYRGRAESRHGRKIQALSDTRHRAGKLEVQGLRVGDPPDLSQRGATETMHKLPGDRL